MLISGDSHVVEPLDLWRENLPASLRKRAPHAVRDPANHHWYFVDPEGHRGVDLTASATAGLTADERDARLRADPEADIELAGARDPVARLRDLWRDGTVADVLYPTATLSLMGLRDAALQEACFRVYNDWIADYCSIDPVRLAGLGVLPCWKIEAAVAELRRCADLGLRGAAIWTSPPEEESFFERRYEPLWAAAAEAQMPISLHTLAGNRASREIAGYGQSVESTFFFGFTTRLELQRSLCELIVSGVFERHPKLRIVAAEGGIDYAATLERRLDGGHAKSWGHLDHELSRKPSEYFRRNVFLTYISDPVGLHNIRFTGSSHFLWSGDYPHDASTWPRSEPRLRRECEAAGLDDETIEALTCTNAARLYGFDLAAVAQRSPALRGGDAADRSEGAPPAKRLAPQGVS